MIKSGHLILTISWTPWLLLLVLTLCSFHCFLLEPVPLCPLAAATPLVVLLRLPGFMISSSSFPRVLTASYISQQSMPLHILVLLKLSELFNTMASGEDYLFFFMVYLLEKSQHYAASSSRSNAVFSLNRAFHFYLVSWSEQGITNNLTISVVLDNKSSFLLMSVKIKARIGDTGALLPWVIQGSRLLLAWSPLLDHLHPAPHPPSCRKFYGSGLRWYMRLLPTFI